MSYPDLMETDPVAESGAFLDPELAATMMRYYEALVVIDALLGPDDGPAAWLSLAVRRER